MEAVIEAMEREMARHRHPARGRLSLEDTVAWLTVLGVLAADETAEGNR